MKTVLVTGGAGFIGSNLVKHLAIQGFEILVVDRADETWNRRNFCDLSENMNVRIFSCDLRDRNRLETIFDKYRPIWAFHLAAESHVDKSIVDPQRFLQSNVEGTYILLDEITRYWNKTQQPGHFRFHYCSTDEVYGSLGPAGSFHETLPLHPNNPYSATKAAGEHLASAWANTHRLPVLITRSANNYGPCQGPDKFMPLTIGRCLQGKPILIHGSGKNVRDWLHVEDHVRALQSVLEMGMPGEVYNIGGGENSERTNLQIAEMICDCIDELRGNEAGTSRNLITFIQDRPGNDLRYSMDMSKLHAQTGWMPEKKLESGILDTVKWYIENDDYYHMEQERKYYEINYR